MASGHWDYYSGCFYIRHPGGLRLGHVSLVGVLRVWNFPWNPHVPEQLFVVRTVTASQDYDYVGVLASGRARWCHPWHERFCESRDCPEFRVTTCLNDEHFSHCIELASYAQ
jgi:hypothetical protein